ncbi:MAG: 1-deoxy-D-xylulose-5-phosphate synthase N-terminal domain-containing protein, partial [Desulfovibrionales bacterium]
MKNDKLEQISRLIRYWILSSTTEAGSGHPTSSLSATELMTGLFFGSPFRFDAENPGHPNNDRIIFSKGHASPLFYSLWAAAGKVNPEDLMDLRRFGGPLEGHPTPAFPFTEAATGSLGQGLSIGVGMALNAKYLDDLPYRTCVLLGDSEMAEGSQWEAVQIAAHYGLDNLIAILDVNRLGQCGQTMYGRDLEAYAERVGAFGWETVTTNGHSFPDICKAYEHAWSTRGKPVMIIAATVKGKGVSFLEDRPGWHGKTLTREEYNQALEELGAVDMSVRGDLKKPEHRFPAHRTSTPAEPMSYAPGEEVSTRKAYGQALARLSGQIPEMVVLDAEVSNSTYS